MNETRLKEDGQTMVVGALSTDHRLLQSAVDVRLAR